MLLGLLTAASALATARGLAAEVTVRFTNTPKGKDVVAVAEVGRNLLNLGDEVGVKIPRACRNGLCGACTCDVVDGLTGERTTIKACSTTLNEMPDGTEILVDLTRTQSPKDDVMARSMKRFDDNWENEFVPDFKRGERKTPRDDSAVLQFAATGRPDAAEDFPLDARKRARVGAVVPRDEPDDAPELLPGQAKRFYHPGAKFDTTPPWEKNRKPASRTHQPALVTANEPAPSLEQRFPQSNDPYAAPWERIW